MGARREGDASGSPLSFEEWVLYLFDNPPGYQWFELLDTPEATPPPVLLDYLTRLFEAAGDLLQPFSNDQIAQSLWFVAGGDELLVLLDPSLPWEGRRRCLEATTILFEQCFGLRCDAGLSHLNEASDNPLNAVCYMWWDLFPTWGSPGDPDRADFDSTALEVMRRLLSLDSDPCREAALHGLGHWGLHYPAETARIIDAFVTGAGAGDPRPELLAYARAARTGCVQ